MGRSHRIAYLPRIHRRNVFRIPGTLPQPDGEDDLNTSGCASRRAFLSSQGGAFISFISMFLCKSP